jgi:hypothetical protein
MSYEKQLDPASRLDYIRKELLKNYDFFTHPQKSLRALAP